MSTISIEGMKFFAHHGYYLEEQVLGNYYLVDVKVKTGVEEAAISDDLYKTINYETIYLICDAVMRRNAKLLETVATTIALALKHQFQNIEELKVKVKKLSPPIGTTVDSSSVEVDGNFSKSCGRCGKPMLCYGDESCWCMNLRIFDKTLDQIKSNYGNKCLCKECLLYFTGPQ